MANFKVVYEHWRDHYFNPSEEYYLPLQEEGVNFDEDSREAQEQRLDSNQEFQRKLNEIKNGLIPYFRYMLETKIRPLKNSEALLAEMQILLSTWCNEIDFTPNNNKSFIMQTDEYFFFNNVENFIDELLWGSLGENAEIYEMIALINRSFTQFCFIRIASNLDDPEEETLVTVFEVKDGRVIKRHQKWDGGFDLEQYTVKEVGEKLEKQGISLALERKSE